MNKISQDEVQGTWRRCLIQFVALDYAIYGEEVGGGPPTAAKPEIVTHARDGGNPSPEEGRSQYSFLQDMLSSPLLYPRALCELKRVENLGEKIETMTGVHPQKEMVDLFSGIIRGFGSSDDTTGVSEKEKFLRFLFNSAHWSNLDKVRGNIKKVIPAAGLTKLIEVLRRNVPGLIRNDNSLDIGIRDHFLHNWPKIIDPKTWGVRIEAVSSLDSQLPIVEEAFSTAKSTPVQQEFSEEASRVMMRFLRPAIELGKKGLESVLKEPTSLTLRNVFSVISSPETKGETRLLESYRDQLGFLETALWVMSDEPYLSTLFDRVRSRLARNHILRRDEVHPSSLFQGSLARAREITGVFLLGLSLERFRRERNSLAQLGIVGISKLAGGYAI